MCGISFLIEAAYLWPQGTAMPWLQGHGNAVPLQRNQCGLMFTVWMQVAVCAFARRFAGRCLPAHFVQEARPGLTTMRSGSVDALKNLQRISEIPPDGNFLEIDAAVGADHRGHGSLRTKQQRVNRQESRYR